MLTLPKWMLPAALVLVACQTVAIFSPTQPASARTSSSASSCRNSNRLAGGSTIGSQVDGNLVTICLSRTLLKKLQPKPVTSPKTVPKPSIRAIPLAPRKPITRPIPAAIPKPILRPKPVVKPKPKAPTKPKSSSSNRGNNSVFRPSISAPRATPQLLRPGGATNLSTSQVVQLGHAKLLGSRVVVRFTPVRLSWDFGDGSASVETIGARSATRHTYANAGKYLVRLHVTYRVEYRLASGAWYRDPDSVVMVAPSPTITVKDQNTSNRGALVLVMPQG